MFIVKEDLIDKCVSVHDSLDQLVFHGRVRAIALQSQHYVLLVEVTKAVRPYNGSQLTVGSLVISTIPNEWETVKIDATASNEERAKEAQR